MVSVLGLVLTAGVLLVPIIAAPQSDPPCLSQASSSTQLIDSENKFAMLFRQMIARHQEIINTDCQLDEECPEGYACDTKCVTNGSRRAKMINLYSRW